MNDLSLKYLKHLKQNISKPLVIAIFAMIYNNSIYATTTEIPSQQETIKNPATNPPKPALDQKSTNQNISNPDNSNINKNNNFITSIDNSRNYFNKALSLAKGGDHKSAISFLDLAIHLDPKYVDAYIARASLAEKSGNLQSAIIDYTHALNITPSDKIYYDRGVIELALRLFADAARDFTSAIELNPQFARAYNERGIAFLANNMLEEAKNDFIQAFILNDKIVFALEKIAEINMAQSHFDQALEKFNQLIELKPNDAKAYFNRGQVYESLQMHDQALKDYNTGVELNKNTTNKDVDNPDKQVNSHSI